ncbi:PE-PGRS family protein PE_PGRS26 [Drosophila grimshawi]|uniref:GH24333 n=1 Tax=Drosophila grimshawi TaxID=7222 RepID=B4JMG8_DROGR|nr:PE-PGRS family protein PE_PGRS26 [Drosophila grimshawi]EDV91911.1 GH24333 [Drosophila grimshawi]
MALTDRRCSVVIWICAFACLATVHGQNGGVNWSAGNGAAGGAGAGAWSNAQGAGMRPPGSLSNSDPQYSYGYAGVDSRGPYGGAGGNGGYYVSGTDEHGRPYSYNGGSNGQSMPPPPGYPNNYGYRSDAGAVMASMGMALALALLASRS